MTKYVSLIIRLAFFTCFLAVGIAAQASQVKTNSLPDKIIVLYIYETGFITDGRDTINSDDLAQYIRERLFKNYTGTGKMYDKIKLQKESENIPTPVLEIVLKEIKAGQKAALAEICLHKYKKYYDGLDKKKQRKIMKQFPVLFQSDYN